MNKLKALLISIFYRHNLINKNIKTRQEFLKAVNSCNHIAIFSYELDDYFTVCKKSFIKRLHEYIDEDKNSQAIFNLSELNMIEKPVINLSDNILYIG